MKKMSMTFEVERGQETVEYVAEFVFCPGQPERGPTYSCAGEPAEPPGVEDVEVYWEHKDPRTSKTVRERRPELDCLVDEDELLEYALEDDSGYDPDMEADAARERRGER